MNRKTCLFIAALFLALTASSFAYFDPTTTSFLSRDPIREDGGVNLYAYCNDDPVGNFDAIGESDVSNALADWQFNHLVLALSPGAQQAASMWNRDNQFGPTHSIYDTEIAIEMWKRYLIQAGVREPSKEFAYDVDKFARIVRAHHKADGLDSQSVMNYFDSPGMRARGELIATRQSIALTPVNAFSRALFHWDLAKWDWDQHPFMPWVDVALWVAPEARGVGALEHLEGGAFSLEEIAGRDALFAPDETTTILNGQNFYKMADSQKAMQTIRDLSAYHAENGGMSPLFLSMDKFGATGGEIDTITGQIKLNMSVPLENRAGFRAEELFHFQQLNERGWLGRELTGAEQQELEDEASEFLLNSGFSAH